MKSNILNIKKVVLFDIDHTLLNASGLTRTAFKETLLELVGELGNVDTIKMSGLTDPVIIGELIKSTSYNDPVTQALIDKGCEIYSQKVKRLIGGFDVSPCPGVVDLLHKLQEDDTICLGLQTGNLYNVAASKIEAAGIDLGLFMVGAFSTDCKERKKYYQVVITKLRYELHVELNEKSLIFVGDTPYDIMAAKAGNCRSIAVATGAYSVSQLQEYSPDLVYEDLRSTDKVYAAIKYI